MRLYLILKFFEEMHRLHKLKKLPNILILQNLPDLDSMV